MEAEQLTAYEMGNEAGTAERRLWVAALALMVQDGKRYWLQKGNDGGSQDDREEAFDALCDCTWMLRRICTHTGHDPEWLSRGFIRWCEDMA